MKESLIIGCFTPNPKWLPLKEILEHFEKIRDAIAATEYCEPDAMEAYVANLSFIYALNVFKSIGLLLPHMYHESGAVVFRQLWEVSLNLHWIEQSPTTRAQDFLNFTAVEFRKVIKLHNDKNVLKEFDSATGKFQTRFRYNDKRGKERMHSSFATTNIHDRADGLGDPWKKEVELIYHLTSMHAHGAPGAVLHAMFQQHYLDTDLREQNSTSLVAIYAIDLICRNVRLLERMGLIPDASKVTEAFDAFQQCISRESDGKQTREQAGAPVGSHAEEDAGT